MIDKSHQFWVVVHDIPTPHVGKLIADYLYGCILTKYFEGNLTFSGAVVYANRMEE